MNTSKCKQSSFCYTARLFAFSIGIAAIFSTLNIYQLAKDAVAMEPNNTIKINSNFNVIQNAPLPNYWRPSVTFWKGSGDLLPHPLEAVKFKNDINGNFGNVLIHLGMSRLPYDQSIRPNSKLINFIRQSQIHGATVFLLINGLPPGVKVNDNPPPDYVVDYSFYHETCIGQCDDYCPDPPPDDCDDPYVDRNDCYTKRCGKYRPASFDDFKVVMMDLITYLAAPPEPHMKDQYTVSNPILFGNDGAYACQGFDNLHIIYWDEPNLISHFIGDPSHWNDVFSQWLKLYDYYNSAIEEVESEYGSDVNIKLSGPKFYTGPTGEKRGQSLNDIATFISFIQKVPPPGDCFVPETTGDYVYESDTFPFRLDFMTRQKRTNEHQLLTLDELGWVGQILTECEAEEHLPPLEEAGWDSIVHLKFEKADYFNEPPSDFYDDIEWYSFNVRNSVSGKVWDYVLCETCGGPPGSQWEYGDEQYTGVETDNHMAAVNYLAQVWDHFENIDEDEPPVQDTFEDLRDDPETVENDMVGLWAEFWADPGEGFQENDNCPYPEEWPDHDVDGKTGAFDYGFYKGGEGMLFTNSAGWNMYKDWEHFPVSVKKPFYNIAQMLGMLGQKQLEVNYEYHPNCPQAYKDDDYIRSIVTREIGPGQFGKIAILFWYYRNPEDFFSFDDLPWSYNALENVAGDLTAYVDITLSDVPECVYKYTRFIVDSTYSNGWTYRESIYKHYVDEGEDPQSAEEAIDDINLWTSDDNDCALVNCSVALDDVEDLDNAPLGRVRPDENREIKLHYDNVKPWTAMLIVLEALQCQ
jgi:hypothetical protein